MCLKVPANRSGEWLEMLKHLTKLAMDILPSVLATIIGAYIVNHYINGRPATDTPAAAVSPVKADGKSDPGKTDPKSSTDVANLPEPGVKAKGISEKSILGRSPADSAAEKPVEASLSPVDTHRNPFASREKAEKPVAKASPAPMTPAVTASPTVAPSSPATTPAETAAVPDATDLARAAIERLRANSDGPARNQDAARAPEPPRIQDAPRVVVAAPPQPAVPPQSAIRPLPPPITVGGPTAETPVAAAPPLNPPYTGAVRPDDPTRPVPPAEIPPPPPMDLRAGGLNPREQATKVAEDMLSAAKSMFHAVLPKRDRDRDGAD
jgi:hypothetical protein